MKELLRLLWITLMKLFSNAWVPAWEVQQCFLPIVDSRDYLLKIVNDHAFRKRNIFGCLIAWYIILDTIYYYYTVGYDPVNPVLYQHVIVSFLPVYVRMQNDFMVIGEFFVTGVFTTACLLNRIEHLSKVVLTPMEDGVLGTLDGRKISRSLSRKLSLFWSRVKPKLIHLSLFEEIPASLSFAFPNALLGLYRVLVLGRFELRYWWLVLVCVLLHHTGSIVFISIAMFLVVNLYLNVRQRHYLEEIRFGSYRHFEATLKILQKHTAEIRMYNRFYSPYISVAIYAFCVISGSFVHGAAHITGVSAIFKIPWILLSCLCFSIVLSFTMSGSRTNLLNRKLFFKLRAQQISICSLEKLHFRRLIVRLDLMNEYKIMLLKPCFRLITTSPINNKSLVFEFLGFLSVAYMKILSRSVI